jgi:hypothetical protein
MHRLAHAVVALLLVLPPAVREPSLRDVLARLDHYTSRYETAFAGFVAEETYRQTLGGVAKDGTLSKPVRVRVLRSDYALTRPDGRDEWVGFRDTFEVDGAPVRDREERLERLIGSGAFAEAARIGEQNARFNLGSDVITRTINHPTFALELLQPRNRDRFTYKKVRVDDAADRSVWVIDYRERARPTIVRTPGGGDQPSRGTVAVDPATGEVWETRVSWEKVSGTVAVTYGRVPGIEVLVPKTMSERYERDGTVLTGDAEYTNYRQFQTGARLIAP